MTPKKILLIVASKGYQPVEYGHTRKILENAGFIVHIASNAINQAQAEPISEKYPEYSTAHVDVLLSKATPKNYDGIFIIGGPGAMKNLDTQETYSLMQIAANQNKALGAICISPRILAHAGLLKDKLATGWDGDAQLSEIFKHYGVKLAHKSVVTDGRIVTADGPTAAKQFGQAIVELLKD